MNALSRIKSKGFEINLIGDGFEVTPASKLTPDQREFLKQHKAEIITELKAAQALQERLALDDRRYCYECLNLRHDGICAVAKAGKMERATRYYKPVDICQRRCIHFMKV